MQTFLPYASFKRSARKLDNRRIINQINEATIIFNNVVGLNIGWQNHPLVKMWIGHEGCLIRYAEAILTEGLRRGFKISQKTIDKISGLHQFAGKDSYNYPKWFGDSRVHFSHRSALLRKNKNFYNGRFGNFTADTLEMFYPV